MSRSIYGTGLKGKATKLHAEVVRSRGRCERCGVMGVPFQCAHIIPRRYNATRVDPNNAWCLCAGCHLRTTEWASEHMALVEQTIGLGAYGLMRAAAERGVKANDAYWQGWIDVLREVAA
jgi:5-methylcytosine-specific restriction endonuclease McrA